VKDLPGRKSVWRRWRKGIEMGEERKRMLDRRIERSEC
jgi:hypothetical protein